MRFIYVENVNKAITITRWNGHLISCNGNLMNGSPQWGMPVIPMPASFGLISVNPNNPCKKPDSADH
tara:strand:- start:127 stop:327 length:201 start_codon:yes stop_codon:yes gene_type:complete